MPESVTGTGGLLISGLPPDSGGSGQSIQDDRPIGFYARIIGQVSGNAYTAIEVDTGQPATFPAANVDPEGVAAYEVGGSTSVPTDGSAIVWLEPLSGAAGYSFKYVATSSGVTYDCKLLGGILIVSGSNGTWYTYGTDTTTVSSGNELAIPSAGKYEISVYSVITGKMASGAPGELIIRVWDSVAGAPVIFDDLHGGSTGSNQTIAAQFGQNSVPQENVISYTFFAVLAGTERLSVQMKRDTGSWFYSNLGSPSTGAVPTLLRLLKVG